MAGRRRALPLRQLAAVSLAAAALALGLGWAGALDAPEAATLDLRFGLRGDRVATGLAVVAIDDVTFGELGRPWPLPRSLHARLIDRLRRAGARTIAYDVQFTEPGDPAQDAALYAAVARAGGVTLATTEVDEHGASGVLGGDERLREAGARAGNAGMPGDAGGVVRRVPFSVERLRSFAVVAAESAAGRPVDRRRFPDAGAWIDFHGPPGSVPTYSFSRVLAGRVPAGALRGRVVVVGASAPTLQDVHPTPTSGADLMPGAEIQANAISTVLRDLPLRSVPGAVGTALILLGALGTALAGLRLRAPAALAASGAGLAGLGAAGQAAFAAGWVVPVAGPALALVAAAVAGVAVRAGAESRERRRTRAVFARFVPGAVVDEVLDRCAGEPRLGGVRREATVLFCDLRGFTAFSEAVPAERVIEVLNRYLTEMSEAILEHGGTLVSYMGDGIMAVFGSPLERDDHAHAAVTAAREMQQVRLPRFNAWLAEHGQAPFRMGIGINTGPVMAGNVGSERRLEYAAVGDTTNVAARLESLTRSAGHDMLVGEATAAMLGRHAGGLEPAGTYRLRGRSTPVAAWAPAPAGPYAAAAAVDRNASASRETPSSICSAVTPE